MAHCYGIHGDYLKNGKLDLPEVLEAPSSDDWVRTRDFIRRRRWQEAFTYRETAPHDTRFASGCLTDVAAPTSTVS